MRTALFVVLALALSLVASASAADKEKGDKGDTGKAKEVTLEGTITCAKCDLGKEDKCMTVIKVKDDVYYFDDKAGKANHKQICQTPKEGKVVGTVSEKDGKKVVTVKKVEFKK